ncbi:unnamed protein product [Mytilus coruscus]|uniref:Uncharacterized protein n=1 Tax=Mytilus coruscus TaxID=42192 RepID=A0A6J8DLL4_MYTCO|nr:unnamed protein product [Mytilus coruscus]
MNTVRDNLSNDEYNTIITSGSFGEGIEMQGSDFDVMHVLKEYDVFEESNIQINRNTAQFLMETEHTQPGFVQLRYLHSNDKCIFELCDEIRCHKYFSNVLFKQNFMNDVYSCVHGPCLSDKNGIYDVAYCLHSKSWVKPAQPWLRRSNHSWPGSKIQLLQRNKNYMNSSNLQKLLTSNILRITGQLNASEELRQNGIHMILSHKSSKIKKMCLYHMSRMLLETKQVKDIYDNKSKYKQYKARISTLLQNIYHDSVTGWLKLASFFYKTKQFKIALAITRYSLLKCTPEKLYPHMKKSGFPHDLLNIHIFRKNEFCSTVEIFAGRLLSDISKLYVDTR